MPDFKVQFQAGWFWMRFVQPNLEVISNSFGVYRRWSRFRNEANKLSYVLNLKLSTVGMVMVKIYSSITDLVETRQFRHDQLKMDITWAYELHKGPSKAQIDHNEVKINFKWFYL